MGRDGEVSMVDIKLPKLPDRTPVKLTISVPPDLNRQLNDYSEFYAAAYGVKESVSDLIPAMLASFLDSDRQFQRAGRERQKS